MEGWDGRAGTEVTREISTNGSTQSKPVLFVDPEGRMLLGSGGTLLAVRRDMSRKQTKIFESRMSVAQSGGSWKKHSGLPRLLIP